MIEYTMWIVDEYDRRPVMFSTGTYDDGRRYGSFTIWDDKDTNTCSIGTSDDPDTLLAIVTNLEAVLLAGHGAQLVRAAGLTFYDESDEDGVKLSVSDNTGRKSNVLVKLDAQTCSDICKAAREWYGKVVEHA